MLYLLSRYYIRAERTISAGRDILVIDRGGKTINCLFTTLLLHLKKYTNSTNTVDRGNGLSNLRHNITQYGTTQYGGFIRKNMLFFIVICMLFTIKIITIN